jgi:hypothetical protein
VFCEYRNDLFVSGNFSTSDSSDRLVEDLQFGRGSPIWALVPGLYLARVLQQLLLILFGPAADAGHDRLNLCYPHVVLPSARSGQKHCPRPKVYHNAAVERRAVKTWNESRTNRGRIATHRPSGFVHGNILQRRCT